MTVSCRDIPDLIGKHVLIDLPNSPNHHKFGIVLKWNEKNEKFYVQILPNGPSKFIKPMCLEYMPIPQNINEKILKSCVQNVKHFETGMEIFNNLGNETHRCTYWKLCWFDELISLNDKRYFSKIQLASENIIKNSKFEDLVVRAKIILCKCLIKQSKTEFDPFILDLCMNCIPEHFGMLPKLFQLIVHNIDLLSEFQNGKNENFHFLKDLYFQCKNLILNETCAFDTSVSFAYGATRFFMFWRQCKFSKKLRKEIRFLHHQLIEPLLKDSNLQQLLKALAETFFMLDEYENALEKIESFQEWYTSNHGNDVDALISVYALRLKCYIGLKNKKMAKKTLKRLQKFENHMGNTLKKQLKMAKIQIAKIPKMPTTKNLEQKIVRTRTKCSAYGCEKIDVPEENAFRFCGGCEIVYYCSEKCAERDWKNGHKNDCKQSRKKKHCRRENKTLKKCSSSVCENIETQDNTFQCCGKCQREFYCCRKCQVNHWKIEGHKKKCHPT
jgi:tetratricopeptide (TPR) repeat protein